MYRNRNFLGVIPARGTSRGLPGKNIMMIAGKPLIEWSIEAAHRSKYLDRVVLSSDDPAIMELARKAGCEAPFVRPAALADDETTSADVLVHALEALGATFDYVVLLQPTSPLRIPADIDRCIECGVSQNADSCVSVCEVRKPPQWMFYRDARGCLDPVMGPIEKTRRQECPTAYALNGAVYVVRASFLVKSRRLISPHPVGYVMPFERSYDIDVQHDADICGFLLKEGYSL